MRRAPILYYRRTTDRRTTKTLVFEGEGGHSRERRWEEALSSCARPQPEEEHKVHEARANRAEQEVVW